MHFRFATVTILSIAALATVTPVLARNSRRGDNGYAVVEAIQKEYTKGVESLKGIREKVTSGIVSPEKARDLVKKLAMKLQDLVNKDHNLIKNLPGKAMIDKRLLELQKKITEGLKKILLTIPNAAPKIKGRRQ
ncbi:hypothetical protein K7432_015460 [Basidiobolus ranarum]|uniref:Uncharacterized protein n=1 Tax=Basidiobolus ranarum TaxID=34480 RepID=A0ABR2VN19_9FUNG